MRYVREALAPVKFLSLDGELRQELVEASERLLSLTPIPPAGIYQAPDFHFSSLPHELSAHFVALNHAREDLPRSAAEAEALERWASGPDGLGLSAPKAFRTRLAMLNASLTGRGGAWRNGPIHLDGDKGGHQVFFPPAAAVAAQLEKLRHFLADGDGEPLIFKAAIAKALLLNCHPFTDGNGRVARALFNHVLRQGGMPAQVYIPFYEIARRSRGGYEIALRQAEISGVWEPFLRFVLGLIESYRRIAIGWTGDPRWHPSKARAGGDG